MDSDKTFDERYPGLRQAKPAEQDRRVGAPPDGDPYALSTEKDGPDARPAGMSGGRVALIAVLSAFAAVSGYAWLTDYGGLARLNAWAESSGLPSLAGAPAAPAAPAGKDGKTEGEKLVEMAEAAAMALGEEEAAAAVASGLAGEPGAECPPFPDSPWWEKATHEGVIGYVDAEYGGDWTPYIDKWQRQLATMVDVFDNYSSASIMSRDITLKGEELANYIVGVVKRTAVIRCLAEKTARPPA